ncbi:right-handed parallel beta-helix repeat-containing protein [Nocardia vinacea]|uniref:Right-handed parallel beta-helix repeat-containing protein n=1 Tax=Nocardia vinacea TaxID=96468 RepID=A0ABZ1YT95_9NOCA|nr:right-handed parallel beta-helix repeat-containing protein [Nocardia vinacea]
MDDLVQAGPETLLPQVDGSYMLTESVYVMRGAILDLARPGGFILKMISNEKRFASIVADGGSVRIAGADIGRVTLESWDFPYERVRTDTEAGRAYVRVIGGSLVMAYTDVRALGFGTGGTGGVAVTQPTVPVTGLPAGEVLIEHDTVLGNAIGIFVSGGENVVIADDIIRGSAGSGIVLRRPTAGALIQRVVSEQNNRDGIVVDRAQNVQISDSAVRDNVANGFRLVGTALYGHQTGGFGDNGIIRCIAAGSGRFGVEIVGGQSIELRDTVLAGGVSGVMVRDGASQIMLAGNDIRHAQTGIMVRDSTVHLLGNAVYSASVHGITLVGDLSGSVVRENSVDGRGPSAIDTRRARGPIEMSANTTTGWSKTANFGQQVRELFTPLLLVWCGIALCIARAAMRRPWSKFRNRGIAAGLRTHPYTNSRRLTASSSPGEFSAAIVGESPAIGNAGASRNWSLR